MPSPIFASPKELAQAHALTQCEIPKYRQAYSDRTAWQMACYAELAYLRFNPPVISGRKRKLIDHLVAPKLNESKQLWLQRLLDEMAYDHKAERLQLQEDIITMGAQLEETFNANGTQAILISTNDFLVLAFRGTEATSLKDIKADARAVTRNCDSGGKIHTGFDKAFLAVQKKLEIALSKPEFKDKPVFFTGHSLGGALAKVAAKKITHKGGNAACYTFGAPRVGDDEWVSTMKTSTYRVVNAADCVPMLPPGADTIQLIAWLVRLFPWGGQKAAEVLLAKFSGYMHGGDMRYLSNCPAGDFTEVKLLYSVSLWYRAKGFFYKQWPWKQFLADHSISVYRKKLGIVALRRNELLDKAQ